MSAGPRKCQDDEDASRLASNYESVLAILINPKIGRDLTSSERMSHCATLISAAPAARRGAASNGPPPASGWSDGQATPAAGGETERDR